MGSTQETDPGPYHHPFSQFPIDLFFEKRYHYLQKHIYNQVGPWSHGTALSGPRSKHLPTIKIMHLI